MIDDKPQAKPFEVPPEDAAKIAEWLATRGGLAIWRSVNLSNAGATWGTPLNRADGTPTPAPSWECEKTPSRVITSEDDIHVVTRKEVKRFRVRIRTSTNGLMTKLQRSSASHLETVLASVSKKTGLEPAYHFDYDTQEAVITVPCDKVPLATFLKRR
jgi:hypothetical protein